MNLLEKLDKKYRYVIQAGVMAIYVYLAAIVFWNSSFYLRTLWGVLLILGLAFFVHYPNIKVSNYLYIVILPFSLLGSILLALKYYIYLSLGFKLLLIFGMAALFYIVALVDNIFLVLSKRQETIPLYRAAIPWSQILLVTVSIPLYTGVFKIPVYSFVQCLIIAVLAFVLSIYQFWTLRHEDRLVPVGVGGRILFSSLTAFFAFCIGIATSFISTESFLRGLGAAAALMFGLFYTNSYLRNTINKRNLLEYFLIIVSFLVLILVFES